MKRFALPLACIFPLALASCGGSLAPVAAALSPAVLSAETISSMRTWCARGAPLFAIAKVQTISPAAREIATAVEPYCGALSVGALPATTDSNSPAWLLRNLDGLAQAVAR
jgi:hypothetical protein